MRRHCSRRVVPHLDSGYQQDFGHPFGEQVNELPWRGRLAETEENIHSHPCSQDCAVGNSSSERPVQFSLSALIHAYSFFFVIVPCELHPACLWTAGCLRIDTARRGWPSNSSQMTFQRFGPIAFPPSDHARLLLGWLAFPTETDLEGFLDPEAAHLDVYFLHLFSFFSYQAFVLNSPRVLGLTLLLPAANICQVVI